MLFKYTFCMDSKWQDDKIFIVKCHLVIKRVYSEEEDEQAEVIHLGFFGI